MISKKYKTIFVQVPKNAGSSMVDYLGCYSFSKVDLSRNDPEWDNGLYKIGTASRLSNLYKDVWDDYFKFAFVRNPWDRMVSSWAWLTKTGKVEKVKFKDFVKMEQIVLL